MRNQGLDAQSGTLVVSRASSNRLKPAPARSESQPLLVRYMSDRTGVLGTMRPSMPRQTCRLPDSGTIPLAADTAARNRHFLEGEPGSTGPQGSSRVKWARPGPAGARLAVVHPLRRQMRRNSTADQPQRPRQPAQTEFNIEGITDQRGVR